MYRQGDVLIRKIDAIPASVAPVPRDKGRVVLAYGEVTGHAHALASPRVALYMDTGAGSGGRRYLTVDGAEPAILAHEEHTHIAIPPGCYEVIGQREYVAPEIERRVAD